MKQDGSDLPLLQYEIYQALCRCGNAPDLAAWAIVNKLRHDEAFRELLWDDPGGIGDMVRDHVDGLVARICHAISDGRLNPPPPTVDKPD